MQLGVAVRARDGRLIWVDGTRGTTDPMEPVDLANVLATGRHDEKWLQSLLHRNPSVLPIEQIEPGFGEPIPLGRELPLSFGSGSSGSLDHVFVTKEGQLVLVETKLWRNPEARRKVVAQAMEYAAAVFRMTYGEFEAAVMRARELDGEPIASIYSMIQKADPSADEPTFHDALSRNLRIGRAIVAIVGDGIREDLESLAGLLQSHAGSRFTFALIELGLHENPSTGVRVVVPSILARTKLIERGVVQINDNRIVVTDPAPTSVTVSSMRSFGITEDEYYDALDARIPGASVHLKSFLAKASAFGIRPDFQRALNLKFAVDGDSDLNLATIERGGIVDTGPASWWGRSDAAQAYNERLAKLIGGLVRTSDENENALRTAAGKMPRLSDLLPAHEDSWLTAMAEYVRTYKQ